MLMYEIIDKKAKKVSLSQEEIDWVIENFVKEKISNEEMSSLLMAILLNGMSDDEIYYLTKAMQNSGKTLKFPFDVVDKHSTGGVSDSTTLLLVPILASMGIRIAKMSGKSLGFTGGTIDKLGVFEGYNCDVSSKEFIELVKKHNGSIISQTSDIAVADKKIYALRDKTATVQSIPLIASSIMSKKLASGSNIILLDVKYGAGALMKSKSDACKLAKTMVDIGKKDGKKVWAIITNMNLPLADGIGSALEVYSAIETLKGKNCNILFEISKELCLTLCQMVGMNKSDALSRINGVLDSGSAVEKLKEIIKAQGGSTMPIDNPESLLKCKYKHEYKSNISGFVKNIDALKIAETVLELKDKVDSKLKLYQGVMLSVQYGDLIEPNTKLFTIYSDNKIDSEHIEKVLNAITISKSKPKKLKLVECIIK